MKILLVHPSALLYAEVYLRLEPLGLECVAAAARAAGHNVHLLDLQVFPPQQFEEELRDFRPEVASRRYGMLAWLNPTSPFKHRRYRFLLRIRTSELTAFRLNTRK